MSAVIEYIQKCRRFFAAGLVGCLMVVMLGTGIDAMAVEKDPVQNVYQSYSDEKENTELNALLNSYYEAVATNDVDTLKSVATPFSDSELSYIAMMSEYIDSYTIDQVYSKNGLTDGSYLVSVAVDMKFGGIDTPAPGLDFFYVETDPDTGKLYINNLYSTYNINNNENPVDSQVATMIAEFEQQEDVLSLQAEVQKKYNEAVIEDGNLKTFMESTLQDKITEWATNYQQSLKDAADAKAQAEAEAAAAAAKAEEEKKAAEEKAAADAAAAEEAKKAEEAAAAAEAQLEATGFKVITADKVNLRQSADQGSQSLAMLENCTLLTKFKDEGEWSYVDYSGTKGYVKTSYLAGVTSSEGRDVTLTTSINIRATMSESSTKLALAKSGIKMHVNYDFTNGWSQVQLTADKVGYAHTEYLH